MQEQDGEASGSVSVPKSPSLSLVQDPTFLQIEKRTEQDGVASNSVRLLELSLCHVQDPTVTHLIPDKQKSSNLTVSSTNNWKTKDIILFKLVPTISMATLRSQ